MASIHSRGLSGVRPVIRPAIQLALWVCLILGTGTTRGQQVESPPTDTLVIASFDDLLLAVGTYNYAIESARTRVERLRSSVETQGILPDPSLMLGVSPFPVHTARGEQVLQVRLEQMLPWPGKRRIQKEMAVWEAAMGEEAIHRKRAEAMMEAVHAAIAVQRSEQLMAVTDQFRQRLARFEDIAYSRYETGEGEQQHVWKLQLAKAAQEQAMHMLMEQRHAAVASLQEQVHRPVYVPDGAFSTEAPTVSEASVQHRSELRGLDAGLEKARLAVEMAGLSDRPDWGLSATWMAMRESDIPASSDGRDAFGVGVMVRIPLGRSEERAREEMARLQEVELHQMRNDFISTWRGMWSEQAVRLESFRERLRHLDQNLMPLADAMLESSVQAYASGRSGFLDLLDAERSVFDLRKQRIELLSRLSMVRWTQLRLSGQWEILSTYDESR